MIQSLHNVTCLLAFVHWSTCSVYGTNLQKLQMALPNFPEHAGVGQRVIYHIIGKERAMRLLSELHKPLILFSFLGENVKWKLETHCSSSIRLLVSLEEFCVLADAPPWPSSSSQASASSIALLLKRSLGSNFGSALGLEAERSAQHVYINHYTGAIYIYTSLHHTFQQNLDRVVVWSGVLSSQVLNLSWWYNFHSNMTFHYQLMSTKLING